MGRAPYAYRTKAPAAACHSVHIRWVRPRKRPPILPFKKIMENIANSIAFSIFSSHEIPPPYPPRRTTFASRCIKSTLRACHRPAFKPACTSPTSACPPCFLLPRQNPPSRTLCTRAFPPAPPSAMRLMPSIRLWIWRDLSTKAHIPLSVLPSWPPTDPGPCLQNDRWHNVAIGWK